MIDSMDGKSLTTQVSQFEWTVKENVSVQLDSKLISFAAINSKVSALETFLKSVNPKMTSVLNKNISNGEVLDLRSSPKFSEELKSEKAQINQKVLLDYKLPIKLQIYNDLVKNGKFLSRNFEIGDYSLETEGFVLRDGPNQIKIVDRDLFTAINEFNFKIRNELNGAVMSNDIQSPLLIKGGVFGNSKIRIANLFDSPDLARSFKAKKIFDSYKGKTPTQTAVNFAKSLKIEDFLMFKGKVLSILKDTLNELDVKLDEFKDESSSYKVKLKNGKTIKYSDESVKRTLLAFAELNEEIINLISRISQSKSINDLILILYKKVIMSIHEKEKTNKSKAFELIKFLINEDDGGAGDSVSSDTVTPADNSSNPLLVGKTTSSNIAPVPVRLFNGKVIRRKKRTYVKKNKTKAKE
jgi:hypothetical protein